MTTRDLLHAAGDVARAFERLGRASDAFVYGAIDVFKGLAVVAAILSALVVGAAIAWPYANCVGRHVLTGEASQARPAWEGDRFVGCEIVPKHRPPAVVIRHDR